MIKSLQILRAVAALWVVGYHTRIALSMPDSWFSAICSKGYAGVNLFFIISGFIMCYTTDKDSSPWKFIGRRLVRIVPLYWLLLLFHAGFSSLTDPETYLSMFFIPLSTAEPPFLGYAAWQVGWTLNYEMFFYLVFFAALFIGDKRLRMVVIFGVFALLHLLFMHFSGVPFTASFNPALELETIASPTLYMILNPMILLFGVGIIAASVYKRFRGCPAAYNTVLFAASIAGILCFFLTMEFDAHGIQTSFFCLMLFTAGLSTERFISESRHLSLAMRPLLYLGTISYSIYLLHMFFLRNIHIPRLPLPMWTRFALVFIVTILVSAWSYEMIEKRLPEN